MWTLKRKQSKLLILTNQANSKQIRKKVFYGYICWKEKLYSDSNKLQVE